MNAVIDKWDEILISLKEEYQILDAPFNAWLKPLKVYKTEGSVVTIIVPSELREMGLEHINNRYRIPLEVTISVVAGIENCEVRFISQNDLPKRPEYSPEFQKNSRRYEEAHLNPRYTFDTFIVGSSNKFAQAAALAVSESPGEAYNPLYIYGGAGLGKILSKCFT